MTQDDRDISRREDLNPQPSPYKGAAPPLSYTGILEENILVLPYYQLPKVSK